MHRLRGEFDSAQAAYREASQWGWDPQPGLAQVRGRNGLSWEDKLALDVWYVEHRGPRLDARILLATPWTVLRRRGVCAPGHATAPQFRGPVPEFDGPAPECHGPAP